LTLVDETGSEFMFVHTKSLTCLKKLSSYWSSDSVFCVRSNLYNALSKNELLYSARTSIWLNERECVSMINSGSMKQDKY